MAKIDAWPSLPADPAASWEDPHEVLLDTGWSDYVRGGPGLSAEAYASVIAELDALLDARARGQGGSDAEVERLAVLLRSERAAPGSTEGLNVHPELPDEVELARVTADLWPEVGNEAAGLLLGPLELALDARTAQGARTLLYCMAAAGMMSARGVAQTTMTQWSRTEPLPLLAERERVRAVSRAPLTLWRICEREGELAVLEELLGVGPEFVPAGPVSLAKLAEPCGPVPVGGLIAARVAFRAPGAGVLVHPIGLPAAPEASRVQGWWADVQLRARSRERGARMEDLLSRRGHEVVRAWGAWFGAGR